MSRARFVDLGEDLVDRAALAGCGKRSIIFVSDLLDWPGEIEREDYDEVAGGYPDTEILGWEEWGWLGATGARRALAMALTGMMLDGEITRERAEELPQAAQRTAPTCSVTTASPRPTVSAAISMTR